MREPRGLHGDSAGTLHRTADYVFPVFPMPVERGKPPLVLLVALAGLGPLAFHILIPSMPGLARAFAVDYGTVQLTLSLYLAGFGLSQLAIGPISDRCGRRPVVLAGLALFLVGTLTALLANCIEQVILGRILQAMGSCAGVVLVRAIVRDVCDRDHAASMIAYIVMAMVAAPMFAPLVGGLLESHFGWLAGFGLAAAAGLAIAAWTFLALPETSRHRTVSVTPTTMMSSYARLLRAPLFRGYMLQTAFGSGCFFAFMAAAPLLTVEALGADPVVYGLAMLLPGFAYMAANYLAGRLSSRRGVQAMLEMGCVITLTGGLLLFAAAITLPLSIYSLFGPMTVFAFGNGINLPNSMAGAVSVDPTRAGAASALSGFGQMAFGALVSLLVGAITTFSAVPMAAVVAVCAVCQYLALIAVKRAAPGCAADERPATAAE